MFDRCDEQIQRFNEFRSRRLLFRRILTDVEIPFIECIYENLMGMKYTFTKSSKIAIVKVILFMCTLFVLEVKDSEGINFEDKRHWMDMWMVFDIVLLLFEAVSSICFAVNLTLKNKFCFEVSAYLIKSIAYLFAYLGAKQL